MKQREDIKEELKNIAPRLSELTPANPFDVPQGYFDSLPNVVLSKIKKQNELVESLNEQTSPLERGTRGVSTNPFAVDENYFETDGML